MSPIALAVLLDVAPSPTQDDASMTMKVALAVTFVAAAVLLLASRVRRRK